MTMTGTSFGDVVNSQDARFTAFAPASIPLLPSLSLTEDERDLIRILQTRAQHDRYEMQLANSFYMGEEVIANLGMALPDDLAARLRCLVGWPRIAVDPYVERLSADGFRTPDATDVDDDLADLWAANGLASEQSIAFTDALSMGRAYWLIGTDPDGGARITVESPLNMAVMWDIRGKQAKAALQSFLVDGQQHATVMIPGQNIHIAQDNYVWELVDRDYHDLSFASVVRMPNNPRSYNRDGYSEITPELRSLVISASRRMMGLEASSELWSVPRMILLGAQESDFQDASGNVRKAWDTYLSLVLALERDEDGNVPQINQLKAYDPATFTKVLEMYASQAAGILGASPQDLGLYTQGNPTSAEAAAVNDARRDRRAKRKQAIFGTALTEVMQMGMRFKNNGTLPDKYRRLAVDWSPVSIETPGVTADAVAKQIAAGSIPATSDVTLKRLGYSSVERAQLEQDRALDKGSSMLEQIAHSVEARALRADQALSAISLKDQQPAPTAAPSAPGVVTPNAGSAS